MATSNLDFEGTYDDGLQGRPLRRFVINNCTDEDVQSKWDGKPILIKAGELYECGHAIAFKIVKEMTDREIFKLAAKALTDKEKERAEMSILSPSVRAPYEQKFLQEIKPDQENPIIAKMREEIRKEEVEKLNGVSPSSDAAAGVTSTPRPRGRPRKEGEFVDAQ